MCILPLDNLTEHSAVERCFYTVQYVLGKHIFFTQFY